VGSLPLLDAALAGRASTIQAQPAGSAKGCAESRAQSARVAWQGFSGLSGALR